MAKSYPASIRTLSKVELKRRVVGVVRAHYRSGGRALLIRPEERIPRTWEVKGNDQVCYQDTRFPGCRLFQRNKENPNEFRTAWGGFHWAEFKVEDGIPQF